MTHGRHMRGKRGVRNWVIKIFGGGGGGGEGERHQIFCPPLPKVGGGWVTYIPCPPPNDAHDMTKRSVFTDKHTQTHTHAHTHTHTHTHTHV